MSPNPRAQAEPIRSRCATPPPGTQPEPGAVSTLSHDRGLFSLCAKRTLGRERRTLGRVGRSGVVALALVVGTTLAGPAAAGVRPTYGGELRVALPAAPRVLDPARAQEPEDLVAVRALHAPLLELDVAGRLAPGLLAEVPAAEAGGRGFTLRLRPDASFADGTPITAVHVAAALARTLAPGPPGAASPHAWLALPITGADAVLAGRTAALAGVAIVSDRELLVSLAFPFPEFPWALAAPASAPVSASGAGAGPFRLDGARGGPGPLRLVANEAHHRGRPFADALVLAPESARGAAAALRRGDVSLALRPEAAAPAPRELAPTVATYLVVNRARLGASAVPLRAALEAVDRGELARRFVRGVVEPLETLLPRFARPPAELAGRTPVRAASGAAPAQVRLLVLDGAADQRAVADRLQVSLFDRGVRVAVERVDATRFAERLARGDHDVALVTVTLVSPRPALAAAQVALATGGPRLARETLARLGALPPEALPAALARLADDAGIVPLFATGFRASAAPALQGVVPRADGALPLGDAWLLEAGSAP
jgi:peptide/nickel transport system substrate-binding protein